MGMTRRTASLSGLLAGLGTVCALGPASAIDIRLDYTYDTQNFFGTGNPEGPAAGVQAKAALEDAADFFSDLLNDTFAAIVPPAPFASQTFNGVATWSWEQRFTHPGNGSSVSIPNPTVAADEYVIFAGGRSLGGNTLGIGGGGGYGASSGGNGGGFTSAEIGQINQITADWFDLLDGGREDDGTYNGWGGVITFDNDASTDWSFDWTNPPVSGKSDFYSVAIHELAHALGFGGTEWEALVSGGTFTGPASFAENGNVAPQTSADNSHWIESTMSVVRGTTTTQEAAMDPNLTTGTRKLWTDLDSAGLEDIGWEIAALTIADLAGDYTGNGSVEQGDLDLVLNNWGAARGPWDNADGFASANVDQEELDRVLNNWGSRTSPSFTGFAVPEPGSVATFGLLTGVAMRPRRGR